MDINTLPDNQVLADQLSKLFSASPGKPLEIVSRLPFKGSSTFPAEVIHCKLPGEKVMPLFGKYLAGLGPNNHGHRGGVEYEIKIYDEILRTIPLSKAGYWGKCFFPESNETMLVMEYLEGTYSLKGNPDINHYLRAAGWIARLHRIYLNKAPSFVKVYDREYYFVWTKRMQNEVAIIESHPWLTDVIRYFNEHIDILTAAPQTLIHGEYYSKNILIRDEDVFPIDWESAACAPGEIDLASIIEARKEEIAKQITESYISARFADDAFDKTIFEKRLWMAQLYLHFRFFFPKREEWRYDHIMAIAKKLQIT
jgi:thiamine kinase-like enzyme